MILQLLLFIQVPISLAGTYVVTFPNSLIPGVDLDIQITMLQASGDVNVLTDLQHVVNNSHISSKTAIVSKGTPTTVKLPVPEGLVASQYKVVVSGSGGLSFKNESVIRYEKNNLFVYIQTDKTRYSGGQEVKYRAILVHPNLLGYKGPVLLTIYDGKGNKIDVKEFPTTKDGVVQGSLVLNREPMFGKWRINVQTPLKALTKEFEVKDYVVPKFSVVIHLSDNIRVTSASFNVSVEAKYTFNADVYGNCTLQIYNKPTTYNYVEYSKIIIGETMFTISMVDINSRLSTNEQIIIRALVTDNATALTIVAEKELTFSSDKYTSSYQEPITIKKIDQRDTFIPGLTYYTPIFVGRGNEPLGTTGTVSKKTVQLQLQKKKIAY